MFRKISRSKFFILGILIFLFIAVSSIEGSNFFKKKIEIVKPDIVQDGQEDEVGIEVVQEVVVEEKSIIIDVDTNKNVAPTEAFEQKNLDFLYYPNATQISRSGDTLVLDSIDDSDTITNWYKGKIKDLNLNINSSVKTNTNGNVLNRLSASSSKMKIEIEISASNSLNKTKITAKLL